MAGDGDRFGDRSPWNRYLGLLSISLGRFWHHARRSQSRRTLATVGAVAFTIAFLLVVTGVALALADGGTVGETDADVEVAPAEGSTLTTLAGVEGPRLGDSTDGAAAIAETEGVDHASPIVTEPVMLEADGEPRRILLVGVDPDDESRTVAGLPTDALGADADPGESTASTDGETDGAVATESGAETAGWSGEIVLSATAADRLDATAGNTLTVADVHRPAGVDGPTITVSAVEAGADDETPVALVNLADLQPLVGGGEAALADAILVWGDPAAATAAATDSYPHAAVEETDRTSPTDLFGDGLALATGVLALLVGLAITTSFVATTAAMTVNEDRKLLAVCQSIGFPASSRLAIVATSTLCTTVVGAAVGVALGGVAIALLNVVAGSTIAPGVVAVFHPIFVPYALVVALVAALVAIPYPLAVAARTGVLQEVGR